MGQCVYAPASPHGTQPSPRTSTLADLPHCRTAWQGFSVLCCAAISDVATDVGECDDDRQGPTAANAKAESQQSLARHAPAKLARADSDFEERPVSAQASTAHQ